MTDKNTNPNPGDAPEECEVCGGYHRPSYAGDCRHGGHNYLHLDMLSLVEVERLPRGSVVLSAYGEPMITDRAARAATQPPSSEERDNDDSEQERTLRNRRGSHQL